MDNWSSNKKRQVFEWVKIKLDLSHHLQISDHLDKQY